MQEKTWYERYVEEVHACRACPARKECARPVPGEGNPDARLMFVGRNPGRAEDDLGRPFVGQAGGIFQKFLDEKLHIRREDVFVTNMALCHTRDDRMLSREEAKTCIRKFLKQTIEEIVPDVVVVFGQQPNYFINGVKNLTLSVGKIFRHRMGFYVIPSIHPAAVCYRSSEWSKLEVVGDVILSLWGK